MISSAAGLHRGVSDTEELARHTDVYISYLPMAHSFEVCMQMCMIVAGAKIGFYQVQPPPTLLPAPRPHAEQQDSAGRELGCREWQRGVRCVYVWGRVTAGGCGCGRGQGDVRKLVSDDLPALKPTLFAGVPRVYGRVYGPRSPAPALPLPAPLLPSPLLRRGEGLLCAPEGGRRRGGRG